MKNKNIATRSQIERAFNECEDRTEDTGISICNKTKTSCKYAVENGICKMLIELSEKKKKVVI